MELERGPGGAELPHAERVLLQAERRVELLRREGNEGSFEQGAGAVLPDGWETPTRRGRARGDRLRRPGGAVRGGGDRRRD